MESMLFLFISFILPLRVFYFSLEFMKLDNFLEQSLSYGESCGGMNKGARRQGRGYLIDFFTFAREYDI